MFNKYKNILLIVSLIIFYSFIGYKNLKLDSIDQVGASSTQNAATGTGNTVIDYGSIRANLAIAEYKKGVREDVKGCNCGIEVDKYTENNHQQWCAMFASWVFKEAGSPFASGSNNSWRINQARDIAKWLKENGTWYDREEVLAKKISPKIGDVVIFWRGDFEGNLGHADIVVDVDTDRLGYASLIGGNLHDNVGLRKNYFFAEHYGFTGFGRVEKSL